MYLIVSVYLPVVQFSLLVAIKDLFAENFATSQAPEKKRKNSTALRWGCYAVLQDILETLCINNKIVHK